MKPPYDLTPTILRLVAAVSEQLGEIKALHIDKPSPQLRRRNTVRTIHSSLSIEGNTLSEDQITALLDDKRVIGPESDIREVRNAIKVYQQANTFRYDSIKAFLKAHQILMDGLIKHPGRFRTRNVGIVHGSDIAHVAPPPNNVNPLMRELFHYLKTSEDHVLIKSSVFHYEVEFIHPFADGNGRMGRLWQSVILSHSYPVFEYIPFETLISTHQDKYYKVLSRCDAAGKSTEFIEFILDKISLSLEEFLDVKNQAFTRDDRLAYFCTLNIENFSRRDYMGVFKDISPATASRDLLAGVKAKMFMKSGDKRNTTYKLTSR